MLQFVVIARDGNDPGALERRMAARPGHFQQASKLKKENQFIIGGAMLDASGNMCGSVMVVQFETRQDLDQWLAEEPYITGGVWEAVEIKPFRVAQVE